MHYAWTQKPQDLCNVGFWIWERNLTPLFDDFSGMVAISPPFLIISSGKSITFLWEFLPERSV
jgi:hypothetical protein